MAQDQTDESIRKHVLYLLRGGGAHLSFDDFVNSFPPDLCNRQIEGLPYTPWQVLEHMRRAQWDILEFSRRGTRLAGVAKGLLAQARRSWQPDVVATDDRSVS